jgi:hypothetical protein
MVQTSAAHVEPSLNSARMAQPSIDCQHVKVVCKLGMSSTPLGPLGCRIDSCRFTGKQVTKARWPCRDGAPYYDSVGADPRRLSQNCLQRGSLRRGVPRDAGLRPHFGRFENRAVQDPHHFLAEFLFFRQFPRFYLGCTHGWATKFPPFLCKTASCNSI